MSRKEDFPWMYNESVTPINDFSKEDKLEYIKSLLNPRLWSKIHGVPIDRTRHLELLHRYKQEIRNIEQQEMNEVVEDTSIGDYHPNDTPVISGVENVENNLRRKMGPYQFELYQRRVRDKKRWVRYFETGIIDPNWESDYVSNDELYALMDRKRREYIRDNGQSVDPQKQKFISKLRKLGETSNPNLPAIQHQNQDHERTIMGVVVGSPEWESKLAYVPTFAGAPNRRSNFRSNFNITGYQQQELERSQTTPNRGGFSWNPHIEPIPEVRDQLDESVIPSWTNTTERHAPTFHDYKLNWCDSSAYMGEQLFGGAYGGANQWSCYCTTYFYWPSCWGEAILGQYYDFPDINVREQATNDGW